MKIYTKTGDEGQTGLFGGERVPKDHRRIATYGTFDELNAALGVVLAEPSLPHDLRLRLGRLQAELFQLGAELATPFNKKVATQLLSDEHTVTMEREIDEMEAKLQPLKTFILPGGVRASALLHLARTISRRAERELISLHHDEAVRPVALRFVNRISDYLFVCARFANLEAGVPDVPWIAP